MQILQAYLNNYRADVLEDVISKELKKSQFYKAQGKIEVIDDFNGIPDLLISSKLRD